MKINVRNRIVPIITKEVYVDHSVPYYLGREMTESEQDRFRVIVNTKGITYQIKDDNLVMSSEDVQLILEEMRLMINISGKDFVARKDVKFTRGQMIQLGQHAGSDARNSGLAYEKVSGRIEVPVSCWNRALESIGIKAEPVKKPKKQTLADLFDI